MRKRVNATLFQACTPRGRDAWTTCGHRHRELHTARACRPDWDWVVEAKRFPLRAGDGGYFHRVRGWAV